MLSDKPVQHAFGLSLCLWKLEAIDSIQQTGRKAFGCASLHSPIYLFPIYN